MTYQPNPVIPESTPVGITPVYSTIAVNRDIPLYTGGLELEQGTKTLFGNGVVRWEWLPRPQLRFSLRLKPKNQGHPALKNGSLRMRGINGKAKVSVQDYSLGSHAPRDISGIVDAVEIGDGRSVKKIAFHVVNFRDYLGQPVRNETGNETWDGRAAFSAGAWRITYFP
jgi:hypothetical protein